MNITLPPLHSGQKRIAKKLKRFNVLCIGRRWGKSLLALLYILRCASKKPGTYWFVSPSYQMGRNAFRKMKAITKHVPGRVIREAEKSISLPNGSLIEFKSSDTPDSLRGSGLQGVVLDEFAFQRSDVWTAEIRPSLADTGGWCIFVSTPKGRNHFYQLFVDGQSKKDWYCVQLPTSDNPLIPPEEIQELKESMPSYLFEQEVMAQFIDDSMGVFRNIQELSTLQPSTPAAHVGHAIYCGVDIGKENDFSVVTGFCSECRQQVLLDRYNGVDYTVQENRMLALNKLWQPRKFIVEKNNVGVAVIEQLKKKGLPVESFNTTAQSKPELIEDLALAMELKDVGLLNNEVQKAELSIFQMNTTKSGHRQYSAPQGNYHDDIVMSLCLAYKGLKKSTGGHIWIVE